MRADYPTHNFDRSEFTWLYERVWTGLLAAAQVLGIEKPPVEDVHT
jgi:hypothetical protein